MTLKLLRAVIIGLPGCGKGTISHRIIKDFNVTHLSSGDLLRKQIQLQTPVGVEAKKYIDHGQLLPDHMICDLIINELDKMSNHSWLLDGFPRTVPQAEELLQREPLNLVVNLNVPIDVIIDRISKRWTHSASGRIYHTEFNPPKREGLDDVTGEPLIQRDDDKPEIVRKRLDQFRHSTEPVLQFYREKKLLQEFTGRYSNELWPLIHDYLATLVEPVQYTTYK